MGYTRVIYEKWNNNKQNKKKHKKQNKTQENFRLLFSLEVGTQPTVTWIVPPCVDIESPF